MHAHLVGRGLTAAAIADAVGAAVAVLVNPVAGCFATDGARMRLRSADDDDDDAGSGTGGGDVGGCCVQ